MERSSIRLKYRVSDTKTNERCKYEFHLIGEIYYNKETT